MKNKLNFSCASAIIFVVGLTAGCDSSGNTTPFDAGNKPYNIARNMNQSNAQNIEVKTDIEGLRNKINLPLDPVEVRWTEEIFDNSKGAAPAPSDQRLTALLHYDAQTAAELMRQLEAQNAEKSLGSTDVKEWFPDDVKNQATTVNDKTKLEGTKYSPAIFFRGTYRNGNVIRLGTSNYFVLNLFSF